MIIKKIPLIKIQFFFLTLLSLFNVLAIIFDDYKIILYYGTLFCTLLLLTSNVFSLYKFRNNNRKLRKNLIYLFLLIWTLYIIFRGFQFNYEYIRNIMLSPYMLFPYLFVFFVRFFRIEDYNNILKSIHYINLLYLFLILFVIIVKNDNLNAINFIEDNTKYLCYPNFFMFLSFSKLTKKQKIICTSVFIVGFLISIIGARRSLVWIFTWTLMLFIFINYLSKNAGKLKKLLFIGLIISIGFGLTVAYNLYYESLFGGFLERIDKDTRGAVLRDFNHDMDIQSWIMGRGIGGEYNLYETDYVFGSDNEMVKTRNIIEVGYLNLILKGGMIYLVIFSLILIVALINGIFRSKNYYVKVCCGFIILYIVEAIPAGVLMFNIRFFLLWFCIAMCWNKNVYMASNEQIAKHLF